MDIDSPQEYDFARSPNWGDDSRQRPGKERIMDPLAQRRNKLLVRLPLVAAGAVALFWGAWRLVIGTVPSVSVIILDEKSYLLPFTVSRWLDIPVAAVFAALLVMVWYIIMMRRKTKKDDAVAVIVVVAILMLSTTVAAFATVVADTNGITIFTVITAGITIFTALAEYEYASGTAISVFSSIILALSIGLGKAIMFGGIVGLAIAIGLAVAYAILSSLIFNVVYGGKLLVRHRDAVARGAVDWLLARDIGKGQ